MILVKSTGSPTFQCYFECKHCGRMNDIELDRFPNRYCDILHGTSMEWDGIRPKLIAYKCLHCEQPSDLDVSKIMKKETYRAALEAHMKYYWWPIRQAIHIRK